MRVNTAHLPTDLRERIENAIYGNILDGMDVRDAVAKAADDARAEALAKGWAPVMARFLAVAVATLGGEMIADMMRALADAA